MSRNASSLVRRLVVLASFLVALGVVPICAQHAMETHEIEELNIPLDAVPFIENSLDAIRRSRKALWSVVYFGDSTVIGFPLEHQLPKRLQESVTRITRNKPPIRILTMALMGLTPFDIYFLAERVIEARPDQVVIPFNFSAFSVPWRTQFPRPELAGWLSLHWVPRALFLPLYHVGLTADRLLMNQLLLRLLGFDAWHFIRKEQTRIGRARQDMEFWASDWQHPNSVSSFRRNYYLRAFSEINNPTRRRYNTLGVTIQHGDVYEGQDTRHPVFRIFAESLRRFDEAGIPALVYLVPMNWEYAQEAGVYDETGLARTIESLVEITGRHHATLVDLHRIFPDAGFADPPGHFTYEGEYDGPRVVAEALAPPIVRAARQAKRRSD